MASGIDSTDFSTCDEDLTSKKRKLLSIAKAAPMNSKTEGTTNKKGKCYTVGEGTKEKDDSNDKIEESDSAQTSEVCPGQAVDNTRFSVPVKQDYIHVRSRRGQATDSHSLAERVRREKISERMKILQDLVPGCKKVTGKAVMLDEIINYVQSLQCQVEFLSMKLAALNPQLDFNMEGRYLAKDIQMLQQHCSSGSKLFTADASPACPQLQQSQKLPLQHGLQCRVEEHDMGHSSEVIRSTQLPCATGYGNLQMSHGWDDELRNIVQIGLKQNRPSSFISHGLHGNCEA